MRHPLMFVLSAVFVTAAATGQTSQSSGVSGQPVTVVDQGRSAWRIVMASPAEPPVKFAAEEFVRYIGQMTGCALTVAERAESGPAIVVGLRADLEPADQSLLPPAARGHDGYAIAVRSGGDGSQDRIVIGGDNPCGVVYGAYDLLERFGCRWCYPTQDPKDPEVVPTVKHLSVAAGAWAVASPMTYRICNGSAWFFEMDLDAARRQLEWAMRNRYNAMGWQSESKTSLAAQYERMRSAGLLNELAKRGMFLHGPGHSFDQFLKSDVYMAAHPDWFGVRDGKRVPQNFFGAQFCWSNVEARRQFVDNLETFVKACPQIRILYIVPFDGGRCCACPDCTSRGSSNLLMILLSEVIDRLQRSAPDVLVETVGGYEPVSEPPADVPIHPRQRILWAHWGRYYDMGYGDDRYGRKPNLESWRKAARAGLTVCQYYTDNFAEPWVLPPFAIALEGDRRYFIERGVDGMYMLMWPPGYWWNHGLNGYIAGRCFYDASLDPFQEIRDHAMHYFGPRAGPLIGSYYDQWARQIDLAYRVKGDARDAERAMLADQRRRWIDPAVQAVRNDAVLAHRVAKVERLHTLAERLAEVPRHRAEVRALREAGRLNEAAERLKQARSYTNEVLKLFHNLADLNQGLIERNEIPGFITLGVQGWIEEETKALSAAASRPATQPAAR